MWRLQHFYLYIEEVASRNGDIQYMYESVNVFWMYSIAHVHVAKKFCLVHEAYINNGPIFPLNKFVTNFFLY